MPSSSLFLTVVLVETADSTETFRGQITNLQQKTLPLEASAGVQSSDYKTRVEVVK